MIDTLRDLFKSDPQTLILGFGREGKSTYSLIRKYFPDLKLTIADHNPEIAQHFLQNKDKYVEIITGSDYQDTLLNYDVIIKSPGVKIIDNSDDIRGKITSQTDLFFKTYSSQTIGVTGTKGKSTTASLIKYLLDYDGIESILLGNIGVPAFDMIDRINVNTIIVYELSAHQLEYVNHSPHIAVLLNIFPEHLDYFNTYKDYQQAKQNIYKFQTANDILIINSAKTSDILDTSSKVILSPLSSSELSIKSLSLIGKHNRLNAEMALTAAECAGVDRNKVIDSLIDFEPLNHRLEYVGVFNGVIFINDSISTIPQSTIAALESISNVSILLLGGFDRGLDYSDLIDYVDKNYISKLICMGPVGQRIGAELNKRNIDCIFCKNIEKAFEIIKDIATEGDVCLLSPAASSYDEYNNFEHRGDTFKKLALEFSNQT